MSMYLPNDDVRPTGDEAAEFIDVPDPAEPEADEQGREDGPRQEGTDQRSDS